MTTAMVFANLGQALPQTPTATFSMSVPRSPTAAQIADGVPANATIYEFFVSTTADILSVNQVTVEGELYQSVLGSDTEPPNPLLVDFFPALGADSWISTPGSTIIAGSGEMNVPNSTWFDSSNDGPQCNFMFARLTTADPLWAFNCCISLAVPSGDPVQIPFPFFTTDGGLPIVQPCVPEPGSLTLAALVALVAVGRRLPGRHKLGAY